MPYPTDEPDIFPKSRKLLDAFRFAEKLSSSNAPREERIKAWREVGMLERQAKDILYLKGIMGNYF